MLCELIGTLLMEDSRYFMRKIYKSFYQHRTQYFSQEELVELDRQIISKYCLYDGEEIKYTLFGRIETKQGNLGGYHFFTNYRILSQGLFSGNSSLLNFLLFPPLAALAIYKTDKLQRRHQFTKQQSRIENSSGEKICVYGYQFPYEFIEITIYRIHIPQHWHIGPVAQLGRALGS